MVILGTNFLFLVSDRDESVEEEFLKLGLNVVSLPALQANFF